MISVPEEPQARNSEASNALLLNGESGINSQEQNAAEMPAMKVTVRMASSPKAMKASLAQHGHTHGEELLYEMLWRLGVPEPGGESRIVHEAGCQKIGYLLPMHRKNVARNLKGLISKLAIEKIAVHTPMYGASYRVFSYKSILERRKKASLNWVIRRTRGATLVTSPDAILVKAGGSELLPGSELSPGSELPAAPQRTPAIEAGKDNSLPGGGSELDPGGGSELPPQVGIIGGRRDTTTTTVIVSRADISSTPPAPAVVSETVPIPKVVPVPDAEEVVAPVQGGGKSPALRDEDAPVSPAIVNALMKVAGRSDDEAARRIVSGCEEIAPDATTEEIVDRIYHEGERISQINLRAERTGSLGLRIANPIGFLIVQVPKCFRKESLAAFRKERGKKAEELTRCANARRKQMMELTREEREILANPNSSEEEREAAQRMIDAFEARLQAEIEALAA